MQNNIAELVDTLIDEDLSKKDINRAISDLEPEEVALALESLPLDQRMQVWDTIKEEDRLEIFVELRGEARKLILRELSEEHIELLFKEMEADDLLEIDDTLPDKLVDIALKRMSKKQQEYYQQASTYDDDEVGHWINHDILIASQNIRVSEALRLLKKDIAEYSDVIYLVNRTGRWTGCVKFHSLIAAQPHINISELMIEDYPSLVASTDVVQSAEAVERSGYIALPIIDENQTLLGRFDIGSAMEVLRETSEGQLMSTAGLNEESDLFAPVKRSARTRGLWLGLNLLTAFLASAFIGLFEATLQQVVALAVLMPVVASMGGIAGSQTLTLIVRGLALGQITRSNLLSLLNKELRVGGLNGIVWALVIGFISAWWFESFVLGIVIGLAIIANIIVAALSGVLIPVLLDKLNIDPALSGSVILTTVTDIVGFVAFLGLGTLLLL